MSRSRRPHAAAPPPFQSDRASRAGAAPANPDRSRAAPATPAGASRPGRPRRLAEPRPARVRAAPDGRPETVDGREVEAVRESWVVEDRWWTDLPLRRRYWEVVTTDGRDLVAFRDLARDRWYTQR